MTPTPRCAALLAVAALSALVVDPHIALGAMILIGIVTIGDALVVSRAPRLQRFVPSVVARGVPAPIRVEASAAYRIDVRQPIVPDVRVEPAVSHGSLDAVLVAERRGNHSLPDVAARRTGPLGLGSRLFTGKGERSLVVFPDVHAAHRIARAVRRGQFAASGATVRGPLGLGTEFESIRDYQPDDDIRQVNWRATARTGRPMSNQFRVEQDRDILCLVDTGRLMSAPVWAPSTDGIRVKTRLDAALDAATAVAFVANELGDRVGTIAFDRDVRRTVAPRRRGADAVVAALYDLEPERFDSDYDTAFRAVPSAKRALVVVWTDLLDDAAARALLAAVPVLTRRHAVVVASVRDPDIDAAVRTTPAAVHDVYRASVALDLLAARASVVARLRHVGATVVDAPVAHFSEACVQAYLRTKATARL